ncbi:MAG: lipopolysaccharide biosynthesis protein RfbH [Elusimicrobia bacterium]|nr:lipopolysaccharide biosynthesis protein RfbH [Elusimicrobiota bacterium]
MDKSEELRRRILELVEQYAREAHVPRPFVPGRDFVNYGGRVFGAEELRGATEAVLDFFLTAGRFAQRFESDFAAYFKVPGAFLVNSGSSANLLALAALTSPKLGERRLKPGDEVITVAAGFPTTLAPIIQNRLVPVLVDVGVGDYTAIPERIAGAVGPRTRAVMMAHTMGNPFDLDAVMAAVRKHDLWLVEDNCDSLGSTYRGRLTGTFGALSTFSFYPAHHITMGEGGCVIAAGERAEELGRIVRSLRDWGRDCWCAGGKSNTCGQRFSQRFGSLPLGFDHKYVYSHVGYNLKLTDLQAAIGCAQWPKLPDFIARRKANFAYLRKALAPYEDRLVLPFATPGSDPAWFGFVITVREGAGFSRNDLQKHLEERKVETRSLFAGNLLRHPAFLDIEHRVCGGLENTERIAAGTFFVGVYPGLDQARLAYMAEAFRDFFKR